MPSGSVIAKVKKRVIDTGRIFDICVQGAHRSDKIIFVIPEETLYPVRDGVETEVPLHECYFYLLYKRNGDTTTQIPKYLSEKSYDETTHMISVEFVPDATFTANEGSVQIQLFACDTQEDFTDTTVDIDEVPVWTTVNTSIMISKSQFKDKQVIVDENMFVKGIAEMSAYLMSAEGAASDSEEFAKGQRSDGKTVPQVSDSANDNAKWYKEQTQGYYNKVVSLETDIVALYNDKANLDAIAGDLTNIDTVATNIGDVNDVADDITKVTAVADDLSKIDDVYADLDNIDAVATDIQDEDSIINTVAENIQDVNTVSESITDVNTVAGKATQITTVAGIASNVTTVAGIASDVTAVAWIASDVSAVEDIKTDVSAVAAIDTDVSAVSAIKDDVSAVATIDDDVTTVATDISDVSTVASDIAKVTAVADDLTNIDAVADDLTNIDAAPTYAQLAADWAEKETEVETGKYSAKYWAEEAQTVVTGKEDASNKVTSISGSSTDTQYPSAKCVYTEVSNVKGAISQIDNRVQNLEEKAGDYVEVNYRGTNAVPSGKAKYALVESIVGKSRAWNQLVKIPASSITTTLNNVTLTDNRDGSYTLSTNGGTASADTTISYNGAFDFLDTTKKYLLAGAKTGITLRVPYGSDNDTGSGAVLTVSTATTELRFLVSNGTTLNNVTVKPIIRDLTLIFPEGVPSTVAECVQKCPDILKYDSYGYSLVDTVVEGVTASVPYDEWDGIMEDGFIDVNSGNNVGGSYYRRSASYVPVTPNTKYRMTFAPIGGVLLFYGSDKGYLGYDGNLFSSPKTSAEFTTGANVYFIRFWFNYNGSYTDPTVSDYTTLTLSSPVTLRSAGSGTSEVADTIDPESGVPTTRVGYADLGDFEYYAPNSNGRADCSTLPTGAKDGGYSVTANITCSKYLAGNWEDNRNTSGYIVFYQGIAVCDSAFIGKTGAEVKALLTGVKIRYELASTSEGQSIGTSDPMIQTEGGGTINTIQTQTPKIDNCLDVAYLAL